jgi:hypothetical protein
MEDRLMGAFEPSRMRFAIRMLALTGTLSMVLPSVGYAVQVTVTPAIFTEQVSEGNTVVAENTDPSIPLPIVTGILTPSGLGPGDVGLGSGITGATTGSTIDALRVEGSIDVHEARLPFAATSEIQGSMRAVSRRPFPSGTEVPIDIGLSGFTTAKGTAVRGEFPVLSVEIVGIAFFEISTIDGPFVRSTGSDCTMAESFTCKPDSPNPNNVTVPVAMVGHEFLDTDVPFTMKAGAAVFPRQLLNADYDASAVGILDPTIVIDPSFPFLDDVQLVFSANLFAPEVAAVPEPGTLLLVGLGLLVVGACAKLSYMFST